MLTVTVLVALSTATFGFPAAQHEQIVYIPDFMLGAMGMAGHQTRVVSPGMVTTEGYSQVQHQHYEEPQKICLQKIVEEQPQIMIPEQHQVHYHQYEEHPYYQEPQHIILNPEHSLYISTQDEYGNLRTFKLSQNSPLLRQSILTGQEIPVKQQTVDETLTPTQEKVVEEVVEITETAQPQEIVGASETAVPEEAVVTSLPQEIITITETMLPEEVVEITEIFTLRELAEDKESVILEEITEFVVPEEKPIETQETQLETPEVKNDIDNIEIIDVTKDKIIENKLEIQEPKDEIKVEKVKVAKPKSKKRKQKVAIVEPIEEKVEEKLFTHAFHDIEKREVSAETLDDIEEDTEAIEGSDEYSSEEPEILKKDLSETFPVDGKQSSVEIDSLEKTTAQRIEDAIKSCDKVESVIQEEEVTVEPTVPELESTEEVADFSQEQAPIETEKAVENPEVSLESTESEEPEHLEEIAQPKKAVEEEEDSNENVEEESSEEATSEEILSSVSDVTPAPSPDGVLPVPEHILTTPMPHIQSDESQSDESTEE